jgi:peptide/nickel transport system permease protein
MRVPDWLGRHSTSGRLLREKRALFGSCVLLVVVLAALFARVVMPFDAEDMVFDHLLEGASALHLLGTDQLDRDTLSRLILSSRIALIVSLGAVGMGVVIGVPLGLVSAGLGGWIDDIIMRVMDAVVVFPSLLIAVALAAALGNSLGTVILAIGIANITWMARIVPHASAVPSL